MTELIHSKTSTKNGYTHHTQIDIVLTGQFCLGVYKQIKDVKTRVIEYTTIVSSDRFDKIKETDTNWIHTTTQFVY